MPSEHQRPGLAHRSSSSMQAGSQPSTPPHHHHANKAHKGQKHAVGGRLHARVPSSKALHKPAKLHGQEGSHTDLKKLAKGGSATNLKKKNSQVSLKRNRSSADVTKRPKSSDKERTGVHFEIGDQEDWEEASSSASPAVSRSASAKASANNSQPQSPVHTHSALKNQVSDGGSERSVRNTIDGKVIAERLLQRTPSHNTTKMSLATATPMGRSPESIGQSQGSSTHTNGTPKNKDGVVSSRFVGGSGTPGENSPFLADHKIGSHDPPIGEDLKRARSMGNLARQDSRDDDDDDDDSVLAPRSRQSSTSHAYIPPQQSRTQQKLWLQRASSHMEPQQMTPGVAISSLQGIHGGLGGSSLVGAGYDGRDPRIKIALEKTGAEYLVVRRHQDPVGKALERLEMLSGVERKRRIPVNRRVMKGDGSGESRHGLSQSLKERSGKGNTPVGSLPRSSFEGGSHDGGMDDRGDGGEGMGALLRALWEKNLDLSSSG